MLAMLPPATDSGNTCLRAGDILPMTRVGVLAHNVACGRSRQESPRSRPRSVRLALNIPEPRKAPTPVRRVEIHDSTFVIHQRNDPSRNSEDGLPGRCASLAASEIENNTVPGFCVGRSQHHALWAG
jgi:hypothetical protein